MTTIARTALLSVLVLAAGYARAAVTLAPLFTDGAVLQRDRSLPIWGQAKPGEKVTVSFGSQRREATAAADGRWLVLLESMAMSAKGSDLIVSGENTVLVRDVLVGDVWLCSGQSNVVLQVSRADNAAQEIAAARYPLIRHVKITPTVAETPADAVATSGWQTATADNVATFSAVGYFFARDIHLKTGAPIGLINSSWGGTPIEAWMSPAALASDPAFRIVDERWTQTVSEFPAQKLAFDPQLAEWTRAEDAAKARSKATHDAFLAKTPRPRPPRGPGDPSTPRALFNGMINPLLPYAIRGTLWYQGESNANRPSEYRALFGAMITAWRSHFGQGDLPFYWVNLANFAAGGDANGISYALLREAQTQTLALPNTGQALAIDIGNPKDIHPTNKQEVGRRLALLARNRVYEIVGDDTGPIFASATREGAALRVRFTHASSGLIARDKPVQSLQLAGADRVFHPASGRIDRDTLIVTAAAVREPVAVRYAWSNAPEANLFNGAGLPAVPFRTDTW